MTVGETLTEARSQAGLSVEELSERTRIRGTVIRSIEQDDYEACGGDLYVRGYVRAIAGAVGIDAQPLIREYDLGRVAGRNERANGSTGRHARGYPMPVPPEMVQTSFDLPALPDTLPTPEEPPAATDLNATRFDLPALGADPDVTSYDLPRLPEVSPAEVSPAEVSPTMELPAVDAPDVDSPTASFPPVPYASPVPATMAPVPPPAAVPPGTADTRFDLPPVPAEPPATSAFDDLMAAGYAPNHGAPGQGGAAATGTGRNRRRGILAVAAVAVVLGVSVWGIDLATGSTPAKPAPAIATPSTNRSVAAGKPNSSAAAKPKASAPAQASPSAAAKARPVTTLSVASAMAFGPNGLGDGDNSGSAGNAIAAHPAQPWQTQWYATAEFGRLKQGTGLLLDLGGKVTVATVRLDLAPASGTSLQLRVGNNESLQGLKVAATANSVGGTVTLRLSHPAAGRYLLIWITQLPPNGSGSYQESISHISVTGQR